MAVNIDYSSTRPFEVLRRKPGYRARIPLALAGLAYVFLMGVILFA